MHHINITKKTKRTVIQFSIYALFALIVAILTVVLIYIVQGYDVDRKTGQVIQNGLVLIDSAPEGASVTINGVNEGKKTPTRLPVPANEYTVNLVLDGYRDWNRTFSLAGSEVVWLDYPIFIPKDLKTIPINSLPNLAFAEVSSNKKFILVGQNNNTADLSLYTVNDATNIIPQTVTIPGDVLTKVNGQIGKISFVEWGPNDKHVLLRHTADGLVEHIWIDVTKPDTAVNLSKLFSLQFDTIRFSKNPDSLLVVRNGNIRLVNIKDETIGPVLARNVIEVQKAKDDLFYYVRNVSEDTGYQLLQLAGTEQSPILSSSNKLGALDYSEYDSDRYLTFTNGKNDAVLLKNPQEANQSENVPLKTFNGSVFSDLSFSERGRFLMTRSGNNIHMYDIELDRDYVYTLAIKQNGQTVSWLNEHHLSYVDQNNNAYMVDFEGSNRYKLSKVSPRFPIMLNTKLDRVFSIGTANASQQPVLQRTELLIAE